MSDLVPVRQSMCASCPFRKGSEYAYLAEDLAASALTEASRICHSTEANNAINRKTGKPERLCRGARNIQIEFFHGIGFIEQPTDEAWYRKLKEINDGKVHSNR